MRRWIALPLTLTLAGCVTVPVPVRANRSPLPRMESAGYYGYAPARTKATVSSVEPGDGWLRERLTLTALEGTGLPPIRIDWYKPEKPGRHPAVLISPILAGNDLYVRDFARFYAARGLHAVLVYRKKESFYAQRPLSDIEDHLRDSVIQLRRVIDWLEEQASVDPERIGSFAISMGAILTTVLAAVEPRVRGSVLGLAAGNLPEILMTSQDKGIAKRRNNYLKENGITPKELLARLRGVIRSEPLTVAPAIDPEKVLLIAGRFDRVLGFQRTLALWRAMGRPRMIVLPTGHYTATLATPYLKIVTYSFLLRRLANSSGKSTDR